MARLMTWEKTGVNPLGGGSFEDGNFNGWTSTAAGPTVPVVVDQGTLTLPVANPRHGTYCVRMNATTGAGDTGVYETLGAAVGQMYHRFYVNCGAFTAGANTLFTLSLMNAGAAQVSFVQFQEVGGVYKVFLTANSSVGGARVFTKVTVPKTHTWTCIEYYSLIGAGNGTARFWVDGTEIDPGFAVGLTNNGAGNITRFYNALFGASADAGNVGYVFMDAIEADDADYIGPMTAYPTRPYAWNMTGGIQILIDALGGLPGTVTLPPATTYTNHAAVRMKSGQRLTAAGQTTVFESPTEVQAPCGVGGVDALIGADRISVATPALVEVGWDVIVWDTAIAGTEHSAQRTIIAKEYNALILDKPLTAGVTAALAGGVVHAPAAVWNDAALDNGSVPYDGIRVDGFKIDGKKALFAQWWGLHDTRVMIKSCQNSIVENLLVVDSNGDGISDYGDYITTNNITRNNVVTGNRVMGIHVGNGSVGSQVIDNECSLCGIYGIYLCAAVRSCVFRGNNSHHNTWSGIGGISSNDWGNLFEDNDLHHNTEYGIDFGPNAYAPAGATSGNRVLHNRCYSNTLDGIKVESVTDIVLQNNLCYLNGGYGLQLEDAYGVTASLLTLADNTTGGIWTHDSSSALLYSILRNTAGTEVTVNAGSAPSVQYCNVRGGYTGTGNQSDDPQLNADYTLKQLGAGEAVNSPCLNAALVRAADCATTIAGVAATMAATTTRSDAIPDYGMMDWGYHSLNYSLPTMAARPDPRDFAEPTGDVKIAFNDLLDSGDLIIGVEDLESDRGLASAVIMSLFTDRRALPDDTLPDPGITDRRGWWGDKLAEITGDRIGSRLWLLEREKTTQEALLRAQEYAREAVKWMVDDGVAAKVEALAERQGDVGNDRLALQVTIYKTDGNKLSLKFDDIWKATAETIY